jgi:hypothetical protein
MPQRDEELPTRGAKKTPAHRLIATILMRVIIGQRNEDEVASRGGFYLAAWEQFYEKATRG